MNETDSTLPPLLARITHPSMVADLSLADKQILATELRPTIIRTVAANGGHLAPSLGVVELTLALLSVFDPGEDKLVWDVGHQATHEAADRKVGKLPYLAPAWRHQRFSENRRKPV
ncbi:MAG: 1-deoxy-D-xylulose-5-phosphate synthase N-terminal domain-containing protein [Bilophila wadsworthia]